MVVRCDDIHSRTSSGFKRCQVLNIETYIGVSIQRQVFVALEPDKAIVVLHPTQLGMAIGRGGAGQGEAEGWDLRPPPPPMVLSCSIPASPRPAPHDGENFLTPSPPPLRPRKVPPYIVKLYFLLICPIISTIFLMKPISLIKI